MSRKVWTIDELAGRSDATRRRNAGLLAAHRDAGHTAAKPQRGRQAEMAGRPTVAHFLARPDCPCLVRITRYSRRNYDDDNFSGGCKQLRDTIAEDVLGFPGDSREDGITFEYAQKRGTARTVIEVFRQDDAPDSQELFDSAVGTGSGAIDVKVG